MLRPLFFFNDPATTEIYTLSLHAALPICNAQAAGQQGQPLAAQPQAQRRQQRHQQPDRKSTRLNSSHTVISYAVFCLKKTIERPTRSTSTPQNTASIQL